MFTLWQKAKLIMSCAEIALIIQLQFMSARELNLKWVNSIGEERKMYQTELVRRFKTEASDKPEKRKWYERRGNERI